MDLTDKEAKIIEKRQILKDLKNGTLERFSFTSGYSSAWKKFVKIRSSSDKKNLCSYAQCSECEALLYFKEGSGTSHLNRHKCNAKETEGPPFKILPADKITSIKESVIRNVIKYCATDFVPIEISSEPGFKSFLQWFVTLVSQHGNICVDDFFPSTNAINRHITNFKDDCLRKILQHFREALKSKSCSASLEIIGSDGSNNAIITMCVHYFDINLALKKERIFTTSVDQNKPADALREIIHNFTVFGCDENDLQCINIVTPETKFFIQTLEFPFSRTDCMAYKINKILKDSFEKSSTENIDELLSNCRNIVRFIKDKEVQPLDIDVCQDDGTWKGRMLMLQSLVEQYDVILKLLDDKNKTSIKFIKRKAEEFLSFLEPFVDAISDLSGSSYPTANKVILWWDILNDHLKTSEIFSLELKKVMINVRICFATNFTPTMEDKINCFLDPRYKCLKMLSDSDRADVILEVRNLLQDIEDDVTIVESSDMVQPRKKSKLCDYEATKSDIQALSKDPKPKSKKKEDRFKKYETNPSDDIGNDECDIYLKLPPTQTTDFESEIEVVKKFWKSNKKKLPKLFKLVMTRLHIPACSSTELQLKAKLELKCLDDFLFIRDHISDICEDEW